MKFLIFFIFITLYVNLSEQMAQFKNCSEGEVSSKNYEKICARVTCVSGQRFMLGCPEYICKPGKEIGTKDVDFTKVYPDCCGGPICEE